MTTVVLAPVLDLRAAEPALRERVALPIIQHPLPVAVSIRQRQGAVALAFGMAAATIFPALVLGIFVERVNAKGVIAGMLAGGLATVTYIFMYLGWFFIPGTANFPNTPDNWLFGISPLSFGVIGAVINIITTLVVSNVTEAPSEELREMVRRVRYP